MVIIKIIYRGCEKRASAVNQAWVSTVVWKRRLLESGCTIHMNRGRVRGGAGLVGGGAGVDPAVSRRY